MKAYRLLFWLLVALPTVSAAAHAAGRIEVNQTVVDAAGGFPYAISAPGNYVLTGPLVVPADRDGFLLATNDVVIDLNGFSISGPAECNSTSCPLGVGSAIRGQSQLAHARSTTIRNGVVRGFGASCVQLTFQARVDRLLVTECGRFGIFVANGSLVTNNRVYQTGENGVHMNGASPPTAFAHNTISAAGLGGGSFTAAARGRPTAGNFCDDGSCSAEGKRRFYLSPGLHPGSAASSVCALDFHIAQLSEIWDPSGLHYDSFLGFVTPGRAGAPMVKQGWIYGPDEGSDCSEYTSGTGIGQMALLTVINALAEWRVGNISCSPDQMRHVWCVQD